MKTIKTYGEILESIKRYNAIYEKSMNPEKLKKINRFKDSGNLKEILKELNIIVSDVKQRLSNIDFDDIEYSYKNDIINITYSDEIYALLISLKYRSRKDNEIDDRLFGGGWDDISLEIELDNDLFNRIDIINGLPNFIKGIGLGTKIYKKLIKDFNYISSFDGYEPSIDSSKVWESLAKDDDLFTFTKDENIITFWNDYTYNDIIEKLKDFYKDSDINNVQFDDTFLTRYNLTDDSLKEILF